MIPYLNTLEEPLKLLGVIFLLYSIMKWVMWMGIPNIEYKNYRTIKNKWINMKKELTIKEALTSGSRFLILITMAILSFMFMWGLIIKWKLIIIN